MTRAEASALHRARILEIRAADEQARRGRDGGGGKKDPAADGPPAPPAGAGPTAPRGSAAPG